MNVECPSCGYDNDVEGEDLPNRACDDSEFECSECENVFNIGWYATVEVR